MNIRIKTKPAMKDMALTLRVMKEPIDQTWSIERIVTEAPPRSWEHVVQDAMPELHDVSTILDEQEKLYGQYYPLKKDIFAAFQYTPLPNVKVVIFGQDPYHQTVHINGVTLPRAVGLAFSVRREDSIPSSLQNIYTELANTVRGFARPDHGDLREWATQGVLLLNTCLTVRPGQPGSHGEIWLGFIRKVLKAIAQVNPYCVYMLWGREAQKLKPLLGERSIVLEAAHPSGLSAQRGFFGCNHFNLANDALIRQGKIGINWRISTLAELARANTKITPPAPIDNGHKPKLAPVQVELLPTILPAIPLKPFIQNHTPQKAAVPILPIIPNIKPPSPIVQQIKLAGNDVQSPVKQNISPVPMIPRIQFGPLLNTTPILNIGSPEPNPLPVIKPIIQPTLHPIMPPKDLPIIPPLIH